MMKHLYKIGSILLLSILVFSYTYCREDISENTIIFVENTLSEYGIIRGKIFFRDDKFNSSLAGTFISLFIDIDDWQKPNNNKLSDHITNAFSDGFYFFKTVSPGSYILSAWRDNNNDKIINYGDFWGAHGTGTYPDIQPNFLRIEIGDTLIIDIELSVID